MNSTANLRVAILPSLLKVAEAQYNLYMRVDTNTNGHRQWFYFSVRNNKPGLVRFNVYRFKKKFSLFQRGMRPYVRSFRSGRGWQVDTKKVQYRQEKLESINDTPTYYLSFEYRFQFEDDEVFFASGLPYTLTYLNKRLQELLEQPDEPCVTFELSSAGKTMCGQNLPLLTIYPTKNHNASMQGHNYIIINARTHSGQTSSSWVLDGLLEKIKSDKQAIKWMTECNVCFKIVPMLNPDGVFIGNYRTGVVGDDFNRKFATGKKEIFPEIHSLKKLVSDSKRQGRVLLFLDLHGHSVLKSSFIYGPSEDLFTNHPLRNLAFVLWHSSKYFRLSSCKFQFNKDLNQTARVYFQQRESILSYTFQISLGLFYQGAKTVQIMPEDFKSLGESLYMSLKEMITKQKMQGFTTMESSYAPIANIVPQQQLKGGASRKNSDKNKKVFLGKQRQTCLEKIKSIRKQLTEENITKNDQNQHRAQFNSVDARTKTPKVSLIKIKDQQHHKNTSEIGHAKNQSIKVTNQKASKKYSHSIGFLESEGNKIDFESSNRNRKYNKHENQFKIRRKSDILRNLPESVRKKLGVRLQHGFTSTKFIGNMDSHEYSFERSVTYDTAQISQQIGRMNEINEDNDTSEAKDTSKEGWLDDISSLQAIYEKFSEEYESINDSDGSSDDLNDKQKQYLLECIRINGKTHIGLNEDEQKQDDNADDKSENHHNTVPLPININAFKEVKFIEMEPNKTIYPFKPNKRQSQRLKDITYKSLGKGTLEDESGLVPQMVQKKQLNERTTRKSVREPYYLLQVKNRHNF